MTTQALIPKVNEMIDHTNYSLYTPDRPGDILVLVCHNTAGQGDRNDTDLATATILNNGTVQWFLTNPGPVSIHWYIGPEAMGAPLYHFVHEYDTAYHVGGNPSSGFPSHYIDPDTGVVYTGFGLNQVAIGIEVFGSPNEPVGPNQRNTIKYLLTEYQGGIFGRHPNLKDGLRIVDHARLEPGDRTDGRNWVNYARSVAMGQ